MILQWRLDVGMYVRFATVNVTILWLIYQFYQSFLHFISLTALHNC